MSTQTRLFKTSLSDADIACGVARGKSLKAEFMGDTLRGAFEAVKAKIWPIRSNAAGTMPRKCPHCPTR